MPEATETPNPNPNPNPNPGRAAGAEGGDEMVSKAEFTSVKDDMHRFKEEARIAKEKLAKLGDDDMKAKEQWKDFAAAKEKEANESKQKYDALVNSIQDRAKISAVKEQAIKLGLVENAYDDLELMELKDVIVETTSTGRVNVMGAKAAAERIKTLKPHWFAKPGGPNLNPNTPNTVTTTPSGSSYDDLLKLEAEAKKTGDYTEYKKALMALKTKRA